MSNFIQQCDDYLNDRTGKYEWRRVRYLAALGELEAAGLNDDSTVIDVGAGWTEFDYCLRVDGRSRCRYIPLDGCINGENFDNIYWRPPRHADFFVGLEIIEHLNEPEAFIRALKEYCGTAIVLSTPNPATTDVLGMDKTHKTSVWADDLEAWGGYVTRHSFYGKLNDSLLAVFNLKGE